MFSSIVISEAVSVSVHSPQHRRSFEAGKKLLDSVLFNSKSAKSLNFLPSSHTHTDDNTGEVAKLWTTHAGTRDYFL